MDTPPFFVLLFVHLSGLFLGFGSVLVTDLYGTLWLRNRLRFTELVHISGVTSKFIWAGWGIAVAAGVPLLVLKGEADNLMMVKLFFVALIGVNGVALHRLHKRVRGYEEGDDVPTPVLFRLALALGVSQLGWWSAILIGFLHRHVQSIIEWPARPWLLIAGVTAALLAVWAGGEWLIRHNRAAAEEVKDQVVP